MRGHLRLKPAAAVCAAVVLVLLLQPAGGVARAPWRSAGPPRPAVQLLAALAVPGVLPARSLDHTLAGTLTRPVYAKGPVPALVLVSGSGPHERDGGSQQLPGYRPFLQIAETLTRHGIAVLRLDDRGVGRSTGDFNSATPADFAKDIKAALAWLRARPDIDGERQGLVGHSEGGLVAMMVAAAEPSLRAVVLLASPGRNLRSIVEYQTRYKLDQDPGLSPADRDRLVSTTMAKWDVFASDWPRLRFSRSYDPLPTARRVKAPVLILHGSTDRQVPPEHAQALAEALRAAGNRDVTVHVLPSINHAFLADPVGSPSLYAELLSMDVPPEVLTEIADWAVRHLGPTESVADAR